MKLLQKPRFHFFTEEVKNFQSKFLEDDFQLFSFLGKGSTSRVFLGENLVNNKKVVIKIFKPISEEKIHRQIRINNKIKSYCQRLNLKSLPILQIEDVVRNKGCGGYALIFQYFPGSPLHMTPSSLVKQNALNYLHQVITAIEILHSLNLIHRDLKPSNILITSQGAKLFDFGLTKQEGIGILKTNRFGTKSYYTPEVTFRIPNFDQKLDIWACGLIFSELITAKMPILPYKNDLQTVQQVGNFCDFNEQQDGEVVSEDLKKWLRSKTYSRSFQAIANTLRKQHNILPELSHQKFKRLINLIKRMLRINPLLRPNAKQVHEELKQVLQ